MRKTMQDLRKKQQRGELTEEEMRKLKRLEEEYDARRQYLRKLLYGDEPMTVGELKELDMLEDLESEKRLIMIQNLRHKKKLSKKEKE